MFNMVYAVVLPIAWVLVHCLFRFKVTGKEYLPQNGKFIICPNHVSALDPVFVVVARGRGEKLIVMGKEEVFANKFLEWFFKQLGAFAVRRGSGNAEVVDKAIQDVESGKGMLLFPEGTRTLTGEIGKIKSGAFVIAAKANADIIPCRISYSTGKMKLFCKVVVAFGPPLSVKDMGLAEQYSISALREAKSTLKDKILELPEAGG